MALDLAFLLSATLSLLIRQIHSVTSLSRHAIDVRGKMCDHSTQAKNCEHISRIYEIQQFDTK